MENRTFGTGPKHKELGKGAFSLVYESENLVLKFDHRDIPRIFKAILGKKNEDDSIKLKSAIEALRNKNQLILDEIEKLDDSVLKNAILGYYKDDNPNLDDVVKLVEKYLAKKSEPMEAVRKHQENIETTKKDYANVVQFFGRKNVLDIKVFKLSKNNLEKIDDKIILKVARKVFSAEAELKNEDTVILKVIKKIFSFMGKEPITENDWGKIKEFINTNNIEIPIIIQEKFATDGKDSVCFCSEIPTATEFNKEVEKYQDSNDYVNIKKILDKYMNRNQLFSKPELQDEMSESLKDFVKKTIKYTKETHKFIDFWGNNNVIFFKENDEWKYKLIDPVVNMDYYSETPSTRFNNLKEFIKEKNNILRQIYTYIKTLNLCAEKLGLQDRLFARDVLGTKVDGIEQELDEFLK